MIWRERLLHSTTAPIAARGKVFVSHSQADTEGQNFLQAVFNLDTSRFVPVFYAILGATPPHAETLRRHIRDSRALFVLLSRWLNKPWTRSWIGYEVGIAAQLGLPIVVVEPEGPKPIPVPVPGTTHYAVRPRFPRRLPGTYWASVARTACIAPPKEPSAPSEGIVDSILDAFAAAVDETFAVDSLFQKSTCRHKDCAAEFFTPKEVHDRKFCCPVCRRETWGWTVDLMEIAAKRQKS
jgi:hypothetical protein